MNIQQVEIQLDRLEQVQLELKSSIMIDTLPGLESLIAEMGTRLKLLLGGSVPMAVLSQVKRRLELIVENNERLEELMQVQLELITNRLQRTHESRQVFEIYTGETHRLKKLARHTLDIDG